MWSTFASMTSTSLSLSWCKANRRKFVNKMNTYKRVRFPVGGLINAFCASTRAKVSALGSFNFSFLAIFPVIQTINIREIYWTDFFFTHPLQTWPQSVHWSANAFGPNNIGYGKTHNATAAPLKFSPEEVGSHQSSTRMLAKCCRGPPSHWLSCVVASIHSPLPREQSTPT